MYGQGQRVPKAALTGSSRWIQGATLEGMGLQPQSLPEASTGLSWLLAAARIDLSPFLQESPKSSLHSEAIGLLPRPPFLVKGYGADPCHHVSLPGASMLTGLPTLEVTNAVDRQQNSTTCPFPLPLPQADLDLTGLLLVSPGSQAGSSLGPEARFRARGLAQAENEGREVS